MQNRSNKRNPIFTDGDGLWDFEGKEYTTTELTKKLNLSERVIMVTGGKVVKGSYVPMSSKDNNTKNRQPKIVNRK